MSAPKTFVVDGERWQILAGPFVDIKLAIEAQAPGLDLVNLSGRALLPGDPVGAPPWFVCRRAASAGEAPRSPAAAFPGLERVLELFERKTRDGAERFASRSQGDLIASLREAHDSLLQIALRGDDSEGTSRMFAAVALASASFAVLLVAHRDSADWGSLNPNPTPDGGSSL